MSDFIKKIFSAVLSFFIGLFGGKKSQQDQSSIKAAEQPAATNSKIGLFSGKKSQDQPSIKAAEKPVAVAAKNRKRSGYFMELDETEDVTSVNGNQPPKEVAVAKTPEPVAAKPASSQSAKTPEPVKNAPAPKIELVQTAEGVKAEPAKPVASSPAASTNGQKPTETTFAPKYLAPTASSNRRRPGPSMNSFLDMARQVKAPE